MEKLSKVLGLAAGLSIVVSLTGCPNPNTYGTPRTTPSGKISHSIAAEAIGFSGNGVSAGPFPAPPTYTLRVGVSDSADIGIRVANMSTLGADVKLNFLKGRTFDMAVDPGAQVFYFSLSSSAGTTSTSSSVSGAYLHLPVLFGINLSESVTLVPTAGLMIGLASASNEASSDSAQDSVKASGNTGAIARFGLGANFRLSHGFALNPELTMMKGLKQDSGLLYLFGLGFNFGALPDYSDVK